MLINFCNNKLVKSISCSAGECDGFEVSNLISEQELLRKKGFLVDYFIKPPVTVIINFICEITLNHLIIWPRVGNQKTSGIEIFTSCCGNVFNSVAHGSIKDEVGFMFCKSNANGKLEIPKGFLSKTFKSERYLRASYVQIHIFKTLASSIPALQSIEIWGKLCKDCPKNTVDLVMKVCSKVEKGKNGNPILVENINNLSCEPSVSRNCDELLGNSKSFIPDDFLDSITHEIMIIPMILPSGNLVDNTTLEKYINEESKWGRLPSDPFTGRLFSETCRPKISVALKTRIDKFLVDNCDEQCIKNLARTLGSNTSTVGPRTSSLVEITANNSYDKSTKITAVNSAFTKNVSNETMGDRNHKMKVQSETCTKNFSNGYSPNNSDACITTLQQTSGNLGNSDILKRQCLGLGVRTNNSIENISVHSSKAFPENQFKKYVKDSLSFDKIKQQSLESAIQSTLSTLPSLGNCSANSSIKVNCCKCNSDHNLYQFPCKHYVCRSCLCHMFERKLCQCLSCLQTFESSDPKRVHIT